MKDMKDIISIKTSFTRSYILKCNDGYLLIDTSYPNKYDEFKRKVKSYGIDISQIKYCLLTHHHDDHSGFVAKLIQDYNTKLIAHRNSIPYLEEGVSETTSRPINLCVRVIFGAFSLFHKFKFPPLTLKEEDIVIDGDDEEVLRKIGIDGKVLYTSGHTNDSISVLLSDGNAFVGDAAMNFFNLCRCKHRPIYAQNVKEVFSSWKKLIEQGAKRIYPAHGNFFSVNELENSLKKLIKI
jgi:glyoxylase-like metal-dependent hydrolase (beta-lactamase superfamily II)